MMRQLQRVLGSARTLTSEDQQRAVFIGALLLLLAVRFILYSLVPVDLTGIVDSEANRSILAFILAEPLDAISLGYYVLLGMVIVGFVGNRRGNLRLGSWLLVVALYGTSVLFPALLVDTVAAGVVGAVLLPLVVGAVFGWQLAPPAFLVGLGTLVVRGLTEPAFLSMPEQPSGLAFLVEVAFVAALASLVTQHEVNRRYEDPETLYTDQSPTAGVMRRIAAQVAQRAEPNVLLRDVVDQIEEAFSFANYTQVFLLSEDGSRAELVAASGEVGKRALSRNFAVELGTKSIISQVLETGGSVIEGQESVRPAGDRLADTMVQVVLPLRIGPKVLGALDVQSRRTDVFNNARAIAALQGLADSLALAVDNVMQYQRAEERLRENERLMEDTQQALQEVERLNERLIGTAWTSYLGGGSANLGMTMDFENDQQSSEVDVTDTLQAAISDDEVIQRQADGNQVVALPLRVRGRVIGAMEFELDDVADFDAEDRELVQEISERFGLAVENARLVDESQRLARREALVNQITTRLQGTAEVDGMLGEAARGLRDALQAGRVAIRLGKPTEADGQRDDV